VAAITVQPGSPTVGVPVSFDGTASRDPDGSIVLYAWDFGDGTTATGATASHAYLTAGTFTARLTVTDDKGSTGVATVPLTVTGGPSIDIASGVYTPAVSASVVKVEWYFDAALSATSTTPPFSYTLNLTPVAGSHTLTARAYDAAGGNTTTPPLTIQK
jgi:PKD repeat protein